MCQQIDIEIFLKQSSEIENLIFSSENIEIKKIEGTEVASTSVSLNSSQSNLENFYRSITEEKRLFSKISMYSSGTTKKSRTRVFRTKKSILNELNSLKEKLSSVLSTKKIFISVTPNHSFGLIPGLLLSRQLSTSVSLHCGLKPIEALNQIFQIQPNVIYTTPSHLRMLQQWVEKKSIAMPFLETVIYAGAPLHEDIISFYHSIGVRLVCIYGTTQTGVISIQLNVEHDSPNNCGDILPHLSVTLSEEQEVIVSDSLGLIFETGDIAKFVNGKLIFNKRKDCIVFKNGNKIDLEMLSNLIKELLRLEKVEVRLEKNISGQPQLVCTLPSYQKQCRNEWFPVIRDNLPNYAIPDLFQYQ